MDVTAAQTTSHTTENLAAISPPLVIVIFGKNLRATCAQSIYLKVFTSAVRCSRGMELSKIRVPAWDDSNGKAMLAWIASVTS